MIGGLAMFLYGMHLLGEGLTKTSGGKLEQILEKLTTTPIKGVLLGMVVTGIIQSSSATTVMVVGFVNSGIMQLERTVGIIMGANIGTTVTAWILSLTGIRSSNIVLQLLKPTSVSPIVAFIGVIFILFFKKDKIHNVGKILLGFSIFIFGMDMMSSSVQPLSNEPAFEQFLVTFSNPILGVLAGFVLTGIIQSSSASIGILQALCMTGTVPYSTAFPVIMGQNIGTCVTAIISSIGASRNAKRAAFIHLYFNVIGTVIFLTVFYSMNALLDFTFLGSSATPGGIALIHSIFNIACTVLLLPFGNFLVKLAKMTIKDRPQERLATCVLDEFNLLDARFLDKPGIALEHSVILTDNMADLSENILFISLDLLKEYSQGKQQSLDDIERRVDRYEDILSTYLMKLSRSHLSEKESATLSLLLHTISDFERIADHACNLSESAKEIYDKQLVQSEVAKNELSIFTEAVTEIVKRTFTAFHNEDIQMADTVEPLEEVIDNLSMELKSRHIRRLTTDKSSLELGFVYSDIINNYERIADHCSNIAVCLIRTRKDEMDTHEYLKMIKRGENEEFQSRYTYYKEKYKLADE
jgi:phosphate:Na+ symporter